MGTWSAWSTCTSSCDVGKKSRSRLIATQPQNGGSPCPGTRATSLCSSQACPLSNLAPTTVTKEYSRSTWYSQFTEVGNLLIDSVKKTVDGLDTKHRYYLYKAWEDYDQTGGSLYCWVEESDWIDNTCTKTSSIDTVSQWDDLQSKVRGSVASFSSYVKDQEGSINIDKIVYTLNYPLLSGVTQRYCGQPSRWQWNFHPSYCSSWHAFGSCHPRCNLGYVGSPRATCATSGKWLYFGRCDPA